MSNSSDSPFRGGDNLQTCVLLHFPPRLINAYLPDSSIVPGQEQSE